MSLRHVHYTIKGINISTERDVDALLTLKEMRARVNNETSRSDVNVGLFCQCYVFIALPHIDNKAECDSMNRFIGSKE